MKIKKFSELNENWKDSEVIRRDKYIGLLKETFDIILERTEKWKQYQNWNYTSERNI